MKYVEGNLIEMANQGNFDVIIHGCNCFKRMKSGVALAVKTAWPQAEETDTNFYRPIGDRRTLGDYSTVSVPTESGKRITIINAYTQYTNLDEDIYIGQEGLFNLAAFVKAFSTIAVNYGRLSIGIPKIGSHLAGGSWPVIEQVIDGLCFQNLICVVLPESQPLKQ